MKRPTEDDMRAMQALIGTMMADENESAASSQAMARTAEYINERHATLHDRLRLAMFMALAVPTVDTRFTIRECVEASPDAFADVATYIATRNASTPATVH